MERKIIEYGCIGEHLGHSFSAEIHAMLGKYDYRLCELKPEEVGDFMRARLAAFKNLAFRRFCRHHIQIGIAGFKRRGYAA